MSKWIRPKKPTYTTGRIVIHSDDGRLWDYTHFFKIIQRAAAAQNQYYPDKHGVFCPAINTGYIDDGWHETVGLPMMTWEMVREINDKGGEILSHGRHHLFLGATPITQALPVGSTRIHYKNSQGRPREGFKFYIAEGAKRDDYIVTTYNHIDTGAENYIDIDRPLSNSYTTSARMYLHEDKMDEHLGGIVADLAAKGIDCKHHINAWYDHTPVAKVYLQKHFDSVITTINPLTEIPANTDLYDMRRTADLRNYSFSSIDVLLDDIQAKDSVGFVQNHGSTNITAFQNLDYLVSQALKRGIRLVTHSEAVEYIKSKKA